MNYLGKLLLVAGMSVAAISSSYAESVNNETVLTTLSAMSSLKTNLVTLQEEANDLLAENERLNKENTLWQEQLDSRLTPLRNNFQLRAEASLAEEARLTREINRHNSGCTGEVSQPVYDKCMNESAVLDRLSREHTAKREALIAEEEALVAEWNSYVNLIDANSATISSNFERHLKIQEDYASIWGRLGSYRDRLVDLCAKADTDIDGEALHYCNSVSWDGTKQNLPTLDVILNGTQFFRN